MSSTTALKPAGPSDDSASASTGGSAEGARRGKRGQRERAGQGGQAQGSAEALGSYAAAAASDASRADRRRGGPSPAPHCPALQRHSEAANGPTQTTTEREEGEAKANSDARTGQRGPPLWPRGEVEEWGEVGRVREVREMRARTSDATARGGAGQRLCRDRGRGQRDQEGAAVRRLTEAEEEWQRSVRWANGACDGSDRWWWRGGGS